MRCVHDGRALTEAARPVEQLDWAHAVLGDALLDLAGLLVGVHVERQLLRLRIAADLLEPAGRHRANRVRSEPDGDATSTQVLDLPQVLGCRALAKAGETAALIRSEEDHEGDACLRRRLRSGERLLEAEIVELADRRVARRAELAVDGHILPTHQLGRLALGLGQHSLAPSPEVATLAAPPQSTLKAMAVGVDESRQGEGGGHGRILSTPMATRAVPVPLQRLPNALTIARLVLIPIFVALMLSAEGGHSWAAGIVFGVAGITDQVDGYLARRWRVESDFGRVWDPLADRLMIDAAVILLFAADHMPWAGLVVILGRDLLLLAGYKAIAPQGYELNVNVIGKAATWLLYAGIGFLLVTHRSTEWPYWVFWTGLVLAVVAAVVYAYTAWREVRR